MSPNVVLLLTPKGPFTYIVHMYLLFTKIDLIKVNAIISKEIEFVSSARFRFPVGKREEPADDASRPRRLHRNHHYQRPHLRCLPASLPGTQLLSFVSSGASFIGSASAVIRALQQGFSHVQQHLEK